MKTVKEFLQKYGKLFKVQTIKPREGNSWRKFYIKNPTDQMWEDVKPLRGLEYTLEGNHYILGAEKAGSKYKNGDGKKRKRKLHQIEFYLDTTETVDLTNA